MGLHRVQKNHQFPNSPSNLSQVIVKLKWGSTEYRGIMRSTDGYMNFYLADAEEWKIDGATRVADFKDKLGEVRFDYGYVDGGTKVGGFEDKLGEVRKT